MPGPGGRRTPGAQREGDYRLSDPGAAELAAQLVGLSWSKGESRENRDTFENADASELQDVLAYADVYIYLENHPGRYYLLARRDHLRIRIQRNSTRATAYSHRLWQGTPHCFVCS